MSHSDKSTFCNFLDESLQANYWRVIVVVNIALTCKGITPNTMCGRKGLCPVIKEKTGKYSQGSREWGHRRRRQESTHKGAVSGVIGEDRKVLTREP